MEKLIRIIVVYAILHSSYCFRIDIRYIQYQYGLLCGPSDRNNNPYSLPASSNAIGLCPNCTNDKSCWLDDSCCPETELIYQPRVCWKNIIHFPNTSDITIGTEMYRLVQSCPPEADDNLKIKCFGDGDDIFLTINKSPVTAVETDVTFKNRYCAKCNNVHEYISWKFDVQCNTKYDPLFSMDQIIDHAIRNDCAIHFVPPSSIRRNIKPCISQHLISKCNTTGTWLKYNQNIDFACKSLDNIFPPFRNVFCYICNPPKQSNVLDASVSTCENVFYSNVTKIDIVNACKNGGYSRATFPYKNVYCYMCNVNHSIHDILRPYSVEISDKYTYNLIDISVFENSYRFHGNMTHYSSSCKINYAHVKMKVECSRAIPFSLFSRNITQDILENSKTYMCNVSEYLFEKFSACRPKSHNLCINGTQLEMLWACETSEFQNYFNGIERSGIMLFLSDSCYYPPALIPNEAEYTNQICDIVRCKARSFIYPIEAAFCKCCSDNGIGTGSVNFIPAIFSSNFYSTVDCSETEVYDPVMNECRTTGCYPGKRFQNSVCETILPSKRYPNNMLYALPLYLTPDNNLQNMSNEIQSFLHDNYRIRFNLCFISAPSFVNITATTYFAVINVNTLHGIVQQEKQLVNITTRLLEESFGSFTTGYCHETLDMNITEIETHGARACVTGNKKIHLATELLTCRHILLPSDDYILGSNHNVRLTQYETDLKFYEYKLDRDEHLRICIHRFETILERLKNSYSIYTVIMIICTTISLFCLMFTLITYCLFKKLRTIPGKNMINIVLSLFLFHTFYLVLMVLKHINNGVCQFVGVMTHFFMLSCFGSFTICTVHMFRIFGRTKLVSTIGLTENRLFGIYMLIAYGIPSFILAINIMIFYITSGMSSIGYGRNGKCFVSTVTSFVITVLVPLVLTFVINFTLYIITTYRLKKKVDLSAELTHRRDSNRREVLIFLKLFITTGCSWILLLVNFFVNNIAIYVTISGLNTFQGIFIFIAFVCNKRIFHMYRDGCYRFRELVSRRNNTKTGSSILSKKDGNRSDTQESKQ